MLKSCSLDDHCSLNINAWKIAKPTPSECKDIYFGEEKSRQRFSQLECIIDTLKIGMSKQSIIQLLGSGDSCKFEKGTTGRVLYIKKGFGKDKVSELYFHTLSDTTIPYIVNHNGSSIDVLILKFDSDTLKAVFFAHGG